MNHPRGRMKRALAPPHAQADHYLQLCLRCLRQQDQGPVSLRAPQTARTCGATRQDPGKGGDLQLYNEVEEGEAQVSVRLYARCVDSRHAIAIGLGARHAWIATTAVCVDLYRQERLTRQHWDVTVWLVAHIGKKNPGQEWRFSEHRHAEEGNRLLLTGRGVWGEGGLKPRHLRTSMHCVSLNTVKM